MRSYTKLFGGPDFDAATFYASFGTTLGIGEASRGGSADILSLSEHGREGPGTPPEKDAVKAQAFSLQVLTSLAVGGRGLAGLVREKKNDFDFVLGSFFVLRVRLKENSLFPPPFCLVLSLFLDRPLPLPLLIPLSETGRDPGCSRRGNGRRHLPGRGVHHEVRSQVRAVAAGVAGGDLQQGPGGCPAGRRRVRVPIPGCVLLLVFLVFRGERT